MKVMIFFVCIRIYAHDALGAAFLFNTFEVTVCDRFFDPSEQQQDDARDRYVCTRRLSLSASSTISLDLFTYELTDGDADDVETEKEKEKESERRSWRQNKHLRRGRQIREATRAASGRRRRRSLLRRLGESVSRFGERRRRRKSFETFMKKVQCSISEGSGPPPEFVLPSRPVATVVSRHRTPSSRALPPPLHVWNARAARESNNSTIFVNRTSVVDADDHDYNVETPRVQSVAVVRNGEEDDVDDFTPDARTNSPNVVRAVSLEKSTSQTSQELKRAHLLAPQIASTVPEHVSVRTTAVDRRHVRHRAAENWTTAPPLPIGIGTAVEERKPENDEGRALEGP